MGALNAVGVALTRDLGRCPKRASSSWGFSQWGCFQAFILEALCLVAASEDVTSFESSKGLESGRELSPHALRHLLCVMS